MGLKLQIEQLEERCIPTGPSGAIDSISGSAQLT